MPVGHLIGWTGSHKMLGYSHLVMSIMSLLTPMAIHFMHSYTVSGLQFIAGLMAVSSFLFSTTKKSSVLFFETHCMYVLMYICIYTVSKKNSVRDILS